MTHIWRVRTRLPARMNSALVEFADGYRVVTSRNYVRLNRVAAGTEGSPER